MEYTTQNDLLLKNLEKYYSENNYKNLNTMLDIINGASKISLRIVDWFSTNYAKHYYTTYIIKRNNSITRFKPYNDYKLKLKAYQKRRFDPFCRWERINVPYKNNQYVQTTIGQLNFFKWALDNKVIDYIEKNYDIIENDMNKRNSTSKLNISTKLNTTRKKRQELSISAVKSVKKEDIEITIDFN
tara:strand:+ start:239 stop:796 length:558 start_codon:yes stop_codon:yes gene_type:complete